MKGKNLILLFFFVKRKSPFKLVHAVMMHTHNKHPPDHVFLCPHKKTKKL